MITFKANSLTPRQNGRLFADDTFKCIFFNENVWILIKISLKFVPKGPINDIPALVQIMAWRRSGNKPLSEPMLFSLPTHICVTRPQWIKALISFDVVGYCTVYDLQCYLNNVYKTKFKIDELNNTSSVSVAFYSRPRALSLLFVTVCHV